MPNNSSGTGKLLLFLLVMWPDRIYLILIIILGLGVVWTLLHLEDLLFKFSLSWRVDRRSRAPSAPPVQIERRSQRDFPFPHYLKSSCFFTLLALTLTFCVPAHLIFGQSIPVSRFFEKSLMSNSNTRQED
jgi:hypothetical protein